MKAFASTKRWHAFSSLRGGLDKVWKSFTQSRAGFPQVQAALFLTLAATLSATLTGCNSVGGPEIPSAFDQAHGLGAQDLAARSGSQEAGGASSALGAAPRPTIVRGSVVGNAEAQVRDETAGDAVADPNGYQLNFENADAVTVVKTILGDVLHTNYVIDPRINGQLSLTSSRPVPRKYLVRLLESALTGINAVVLKQNDLYKVVPAGDATTLQNVHYHHDAGEGYGVSVISVKNVPVSLVGRVLEGLGSRGGSVRMEADSNLLIVQGTAAERQAAMEAAEMVDVDWLKSRSVAVLPLTNSSPDTVINEVHHILGTGEGGLSKDIVQMQPINRLNAVLAVSRNHAAIQKVTQWVAKLDKADYTALGVKVYKLQYANAKTVAKMLNQIYGGSGGGQTSDDQDKDVLQPGGASSSTAAGKSGTGSSAFSSGFGNQSSNQSSSGFGGSSGTQVASASGSSAFGSSPFGSLKSGSGSGGQSGGSGTDDSASAGGGGGAGKNKNIRITPDVDTNSLLIYANRLDYRLIEHTVRSMDRPPTQVAIEVTVAEVTLTDALNYGVQAYLNQGSVAAQYTNTSGSSSSSSSSSTSTSTVIPLATTNPALNLLIGQVVNPRLVINALSTITDVKILSTPSLVVVDRQPAVLQVGDQVPILSQQSTSTITSTSAIVNSVEYKDTGIILNVLPRVNANGIVALDVEQQISSVSSTDSTTLTPTISQRRVRSTIAIPSGQTVMLAGLIQEKSNGTRTGIPIINKIRFLNDIVSNRSTSDSRSELIIFIRPQVIRNGFDAQQVSEEFRERLQVMRDHH